MLTHSSVESGFESFGDLVTLGLYQRGCNGFGPYGPIASVVYCPTSPYVVSLCGVSLRLVVACGERGALTTTEKACRSTRICSSVRGGASATTASSHSSVVSEGFFFELATTDVYQSSSMVDLYDCAPPESRWSGGALSVVRIYLTVTPRD